MTTNLHVSNGGTKAHRQRLREAYLEVAQNYPDYFVTLATNRNTLKSEHVSFMSREHFLNRVRDFHKHVDSQLIGSRVAKRARSQRTNGLMFVEHDGRNIHGHAAVVFAARGQRTVEELQTICTRVWAKICPGGDVLVKPQYDGGPGLYVTKEMERGNYDFDQTILFSTFVIKD